MLDLSQYSKFNLDIQSGVTNVHPIIIIRSNPEIYLSQNEEVLTVNGVQTNFSANNLKVPSIIESIDLESRNIKINDITLTFSNYDNFSDLFATQNFLNVYVDVYWKSQSCTDIEDCLPIYKAVIKRINHDYKSVKFVLEDLTEGVLHKDVPISIVPFENAFSEKYVNKTIPMVYGDVDKAPCVLWKDINQDISNGNDITKYIYAIPDRFNLPLSGVFYEPFSGHNADGFTPNEDSPLAIFTGGYSWVYRNYINHATLGSFDDSNSVQFTMNENFHAQLEQRYSGEMPTNPIADNYAMVGIIRKASSFSLIDMSNTVNSIIYNYLGNDDNVYIQEPENAIEKHITGIGSNAENLWRTTFATIPDSSLNSFDDIETEGDWLVLNSLKNGFVGNIGSSYHTSEGLARIDWLIHGSDVGMSHGMYDFDNYGGYRNARNNEIYNLHERPVELIYLPDSKRVYDMYSTWFYENASDLFDYPTVPSIGPLKNYDEAFVEGDTHFQSHVWGNPYTFSQASQTYLGDYAMPVHNNRGAQFAPSGAGYPQYWQAWGTNFLDLPEQEIFPQPLYRMNHQLSYEEGSWMFGPTPYQVYFDTYGWVTFDKDFDGEQIQGVMLDNIPQTENPGAYTNQNPFPKVHVSFWDLLEYNNISYYDLPRYRLQSLVERSGADMTPFQQGFPPGYEAFVFGWAADYTALWNGISPIDILNTHYHGGQSGSPFDYIYPHTTSNTNRPDIHPKKEWNEITSTGNWWVHYLEDVTHPIDQASSVNSGYNLTGNPSLTIPKGTLFPYAHFASLYQTHDGGGFSLQNRVVSGQTFYPGTLLNSNPNYVTLNKGSANNPATRLGLLFTLEESGVEDDIEGLGFTTFFGKIDVESGENTTDTTNATLNINFSAADIGETEAQQLEELGIGNIFSSHLSDLVATPNQTAFDLDSLSPHSFTWSNPEDFNGGIIRFQVDGDSAPNFVGATKVYHLGVKHVVGIDKILQKDFYLNTHGRLVQEEGVDSPAKIIKHIINTELEITPDIDEASYGITNSILGGNWIHAFSIKDKMNSKQLIEDIAKNSPLIPIFKSNSSLGFSVIKDNYSDISSLKTIKASDIISSSFTRSKIENVKTICRVKFKKDYARDEYSRVTHYTDAYDFYGNGDLGFENGYKKEYYGFDPNNPGDSVIEFESDYIRDIETANRLRNFLLAFNCNQHNIIKCRLPLTYVDVEISDIIGFDSLINNLKCFGEDYTISNFRNGQEIYPYFMVTSVNKSIKHVDIECIQMHNLDRNNDIINSNLGDVNRDGIVEMSDHADLVSYLNGLNPYFTEGQMINSDMDVNNKINNNDANLLLDLIDSFPDDEPIIVRPKKEEGIVK